MVAPDLVGRRPLSPGVRIIQYIIMKQGCSMDILEDRRKLKKFVSMIVAQVAGEDKHEGPEPLAMPQERVFSHILNQGNTGIEYLGQFPVDDIKMVLKACRV